MSEREPMDERAILSMERPAGHPDPDPRPALDVDVVPWSDLRAPAVHRLLCEAYQVGGGQVRAAFEVWHRDFTGDCEFDPDACFLAIHRGELVGAALCWQSAFVKDLCVARSFRRRGVATLLLHAAMRCFAERGMPTLRLKVESDNPSGALRLYERLGFEIVAREDAARP